MAFVETQEDKIIEELEKVVVVLTDEVVSLKKQLRSAQAYNDQKVDEVFEFKTLKAKAKCRAVFDYWFDYMNNDELEIEDVYDILLYDLKENRYSFDGKFLDEEDECT